MYVGKYVCTYVFACAADFGHVGVVVPSDVPGSFASAKAWLDTLHRLGHVEFTSDCGVCGKLNSAPQSHLSGVQGH